MYKTKVTKNQSFIVQSNYLARRKMVVRVLQNLTEDKNTYALILNTDFINKKIDMEDHYLYASSYVMF